MYTPGGTFSLSCLDKDLFIYCMYLNMRWIKFQLTFDCLVVLSSLLLSPSRKGLVWCACSYLSPNDRDQTFGRLKPGSKINVHGGVLILIVHYFKTFFRNIKKKLKKKNKNWWTQLHIKISWKKKVIAPKEKLCVVHITKF